MPGDQDYEAYITNLILKDSESGSGKTTTQRRQYDSTFLRRVLERTEDSNIGASRRGSVRELSRLDESRHDRSRSKRRPHREESESKRPLSKMDHYFERSYDPRLDSGSGLNAEAELMARLDDLDALIPEDDLRQASKPTASKDAIYSTTERKRSKGSKDDKDIERPRSHRSREERALCRHSRRHKDRKRHGDSHSPLHVSHSDRAPIEREWDRNKAQMT